MNENSHKSDIYRSFRQEWLDLHQEPTIDPDRPIIDSHHHLWDRPHPAGRYLLDEILADVRTGHNICHTVYMEYREMFRAGVGEAEETIGEVEFANGLAAMSASGVYGPERIASGIISTVNLTLGGAVRDVLVKHKERGGERLRGIRRVAHWDPDPVMMTHEEFRKKGELLAPKFREGFRHLRDLDLTYDTFIYHPQVPDLIDLARAFPDTRIVCDHLAGPIRIRGYGEDPEATFVSWHEQICALAECPNVFMKLGGLGMRFCGFGLDELERPASSEVLAKAWAPHITSAIEAFGPARCMFESNFPPDKATCSYNVMWNAFKRIAAPYSQAEQHDMFYGAAKRFYDLHI